MPVIATEKIPPTRERSLEEAPTLPGDLIFDDGEPLESNRHRIGINVLIRSLNQAYATRNDFFAGGNMFVYYSSHQIKNQDFRGPDFFVVLDIDGSHPSQAWVVLEEKGRYPDVIVELMSPSTAKIDVTTKKDLYERTFRTQNYFVYDPFTPSSLRGWCLDHNRGYQEIERSDPFGIREAGRGWLWCSTLGLWLGTWCGTIDRETAPWLRFYDSNFNLLLLPEEVERERADAEKQRAERLAARLRELGEDPME